MKIFRKRKSESGQAMLEFAMVFPLFIMITMFTIDLGWVGLQHLAFDYSFRVSSWELQIYDPDIDIPRTIYGKQAAGYIYKEFVKNAVGIEHSKVEIDNSKIELSTERKNIPLPDGNLRLNRRRYFRMTADIKYEFEPITPIGQIVFGKTYKITKKLDKFRLLQLKS